MTTVRRGAAGAGPHLASTDRRPDLRELRGAVEPILDELATAACFGIATLVLMRGGESEVVAVGGTAPGAADALGHLAPGSAIDALLARADAWGGLRFVPHERSADAEGAVWVSDPTAPTDPADPGDPGDPGDTRWQPRDLLMLPLSGRGPLLGLLSLDLPVDGRRPSSARRADLVATVEAAGGTIEAALERFRLRQRAALARDAGRLAREVAAEVDPQRLVDSAAERLRTMVGATDCVIVLHEVPEISTRTPDPTLAHLAERVAREAWATGRVALIGARTGGNELTSAAELDVIRTRMELTAGASVLLVPIGAGPECLGRLALRRGEEGPEWTADEIATVRHLGEELGRAVLTGRAYRREHEFVEYRTRLVTAVGRELRQPVAAMLEHLAGLQETLDGSEIEVAAGAPPDAVGTQIAGTAARISRATQRLSGIVTDLISLGLIGEADAPPPTALVDLRQAGHAAVDLMAIRALRSGVELRERYDGELWTRGDAGELERAMINLVGNAVKYTGSGGRVDVEATRRGEEIVLEVRDTGIGLSPEDVGRLFEEFFRSENPEARTREGTGLGLAIVRRIVERHGGRIEVESALGEGSTLRMVLPATTPDDPGSAA